MTGGRRSQLPEGSDRKRRTKWRLFGLYVNMLLPLTNIIFRNIIPNYVVEKSQKFTKPDHIGCTVDSRRKGGEVHPGDRVAERRAYWVVQARDCVFENGTFRSVFPNTEQV